ncbi:MAG: carbohydrate porin [Polyangiaceae bacterium]
MARFRAPCRSVAVATLLSLTPAAALADDPTSTQGPPAPASSATATTPAPTPAQAPSSSAYAPAPRETTSPTPSGTTAATATTENPSPDNGRFEFGSYGRIGIASDLRGGTGRQANVVSYGTRIDEDSYAELELRREDTFVDNIHSKIVATVALFPPFFHFSGNEANAIAVRNLYAQATYGDWTLWIGSRMYRGDDIYLLDWWPLDNQNTVGGGFGVKLDSDTTIAAHVGMQRLDNSYQYEQISAQAPFTVGATSVTLLDRPRTIETLKLTQFFRNNKQHHLLQSDTAGLKAILYGEAQELPGGVYQDPTTLIQTGYPQDSGFLVGGELAYWTGQRDTFVQLFVRYANGLAAYDPLAAPTTFANNLTTAGSNETLVALGGNWERDMFGILVGGYVRFFRDGDPSPTSMNKYDEGTLVLRPQLYFGQHWGLAVEGSYQERRYAVIDPNTGTQLDATEWRAGIIPYFSPSGRGSYKRPQLRIIYAITDRNQGARDLYPAQDVFSQRNVEHFLGIQAEWWFNSSSYP